jgi:hypothetical protein
MKLIISPWSRLHPLNKDGGECPKNYPYWKELVKELRFLEVETIQIGLYGEALIGANRYSFIPSIKKLGEFIKECGEKWIGIDNFFPHLCHSLGIKGVVLWGISDPLIFGHETNINILKDRKYLKPNQYDVWYAKDYNLEMWLKPEEIINIVIDYMRGVV